MSAELAKIEENAALIERVVVQGDLDKMSSGERVGYYSRVCESLGLNPYTRPFDYIRLNGKLTLYAKRDAADQLRKLYRISIRIVSRERVEDLYIVTARATTPDGREDESTGAVCLTGLKGDNLANAILKAETKAKRRVTLSIVGLGWLDETEVETIRGAKPEKIDPETGEILSSANGNGRALDAIGAEYDEPKTGEFEKPQESSVSIVSALDAAHTPEDLQHWAAVFGAEARALSAAEKKTLKPALDAAAQRCGVDSKQLTTWVREA